MHPIFRSTLPILLILPACAPAQAPRQTVVILAAASLTDALSDLELLYEQAHPEVDLVISYAGSQVCAAQIIAGAPAAIFCSADERQMQRVIDAGLMENPQVFATTALVVIQPAVLPKGQSADEVLTSAQRIVVGSPEVPAGRYARFALDQMDLWDAVEPNIVSYEDDVRGVLTKVVMGEADAGLVYLTDARAAPPGSVHVSPIPFEALARADFLIAVSTRSTHDTAAEPFVNYIQGKEARWHLNNHGFSTP